MENMDSIIPLKEAKTNEDLIKLLQTKHGLQIDDIEYALTTLSRVGYYRLSGYGIGLYQSDNKELFRPDVTFQTIVDLYEFNSKFKNLLFFIIEQAEIDLRAKISNHLAIKYSPDCLNDYELFDDYSKGNGESIYQSIVNDLEKEVRRQRKNPFVRHHNNKYQGKFPIWVAIELFTFGNLSSLFSILKKEDKRSIASYYQTSPHYLKSWILSFLEVRNICAHSGRLYNLPLKQRPSLYSEYARFQKGKNTKVFEVILALKRFMKHRPTDWECFVTQLSALFDQYGKSVQLSFIGFPPDWKDILTSS